MARTISEINTGTHLNPFKIYSDNVLYPNLGESYGERSSDGIEWLGYNSSWLMHMTKSAQSTEVLTGEIVYVWCDINRGYTTTPAYEQIFDISGSYIRADSSDGKPVTGCYIKNEYEDNFEVVRRYPWMLSANTGYSTGCNRVRVICNLDKDVIGNLTQFNPDKLGGGISDVVSGSMYVYCVCDGNTSQEYELSVRSQLIYKDI